eukprot:c19049_g1_i1 orf=586-2979(+)
MECNRDEALRAKEIAEKKLASQDYHGALKFLQKALQLFPGLENTSQISAVLDVHIAAQSKINGTETDWYGILQVDPGAEDIIIKKQYKKLALLLHPDKNKSAGAEAAFKLIGEALQVLSDKQQRSSYDSKRKPPGRGGGTTQRSHSRQSSSHAFANRQATASNTFITVCPACHTRYQYYRVYENQNLLCHQCRIPFLAREYFSSSSNGAFSAYGWQHFSQPQQGFNPSSFQPFASATNFASGVNVQGSQGGEAMHGSARTGVSGGVPTAEYVNQMFKERAHVEEAAQGIKKKRKDEKEAEKEMRRAEREQQKKARADQRAQEALEREMLRKRKQAEKALGKDKKRRSKKHLSDSSEDDEDDSESMDDLSDDQIMSHVVDDPKAAPRRSSRPRRKVTYKVDVSEDEEDAPGNAQHQTAEDNHKSPKETLEETGGKDKGVQNGDSAEKQKLADFFKIRIRLNLAKSSASAKEDNGDSMKTKNMKLGKVDEVGETSQEDRSPLKKLSSEGAQDVKAKSEPDEGSKQEVVTDETDGEVEVETEKRTMPDSEAASETDGEAEEESEKYSVPDADFHDFDEDRKEKDVKAGQIWASYDDVDGLPRFYFRVKEVQSQNPFRVSICWLELQNLTAEQQALKRLGFFPTCGNCFKSTSTQVLNSMNMFSHILKWEKGGSKGTVMIYPRRGDVWALYRNWKPGLRVKKKNLLQEYDMVEVQTDFSKQAGVSVACLEKLPDYKTLFKSSGARFEIPAAELCRFSYQVPAYKLQENEIPDNQKGCCWELDPASVPENVIFPGTSKMRSL